MSAIAKFFQLEQAGTNIQTEVRGGVTTFMTMAYIIFFQPALLSSVANMNYDAVMMATCLASAAATLLMAFLANYPIALAPAMGHNIYFALEVVKNRHVPWEVALGAIAVSGAIFTLLACVGFREKIVNSIPESLKNGIAAGIGLLIAFVGLQWAGIVKHNPAVCVDLGNLRSEPVLLSIFGLALAGGLMALRIRGALLIGILVTAVAGLPLGLTKYSGIWSVQAFPEISKTFLHFRPFSALAVHYLDIIFVFFFLMLFDTVGTLVGVAQQAGFMVKGKLPKAERALLADALGTIQGAALGTSTITCYIESAAGVADGARTGLSNLVTAGLFILAIFFSPIVKMVGSGVAVDPVSLLPVAAPGPDALTLYPAIAPVLIIIGVLIMRTATAIDWKDFTEALPAFLTIVMMPFTFKITEGIAFGFISYTILKVVSGRFKELHWIVALFAVLFVLRYVFL